MPRRPGTGRDVTRLLADFGHDLPAAPTPAARVVWASLPTVMYSPPSSR